MHVRQLKYPIAMRTEDRFIAGHPGRLASPSRWNNQLVEGYLAGLFDNAVYYDSAGRVFHTLRIELRDVGLFTLWFDRLLWLSIPAPYEREIAKVDVILVERSSVTLDEFCKVVIDTVRMHPDWLEPHPDDSEDNATVESVIERLQTCRTLKEAFDKVWGIHSPSVKKRPSPGLVSKNVVDLRSK